MGICETVVHKAVEEFVRKKNFFLVKTGFKGPKALSHPSIKLSHPEPWNTLFPIRTFLERWRAAIPTNKN
jgi:hypothetical protein